MSRKNLRYLLVLDFEATCGDAIAQNEIIEFPTLLYDLHEDKVQATFHEYVRPVINPKLTPFCMNLTGITQDTVDAADTFPDVWKRFQDFMAANELLKDLDTHAFITCGDWDLKAMLPKQLALCEEADDALDESGMPMPPYNRWINIKQEFRRHYRLRHLLGMDAMLKTLRMELEGRHHSGIDDCKNILRIIQRMRADGWNPCKETS